MRLWNVLLWLLVVTNPALSQPEKKPYRLPTPDGWKTETIKLPPPFAPDMTWKGEEELRFSPGMFKADSETFFSYALLFWLPQQKKLDAKTMERELLAYYQGLAKAVMESKKQKVDVAAFKVTLKDAPDKPEKRPGGETVSAYIGEITWIEPFATQKAQKLRLEVHNWLSTKHRHHCVFICASPQPPTAAVWKALREIRAGTTIP